MSRLRYHALLSAAACHVARTTLEPADPFTPHTHDFHEVFWIESGVCIHRINHQTQTLHPRDLLFIRPDDLHSLATPKSTTLINIALPADAADKLQALTDTQPWDNHPALPAVHRLPRRLPLTDLRRQAEDLALHADRPLRRDAFLLLILDHLTPTRPTSPNSKPTDSICGPAPQNAPAPRWLRDALDAMSPADLAQGLPALIQYADRSREHLARTLKQHLGLSPSQWITQQRLDHAALRLRMSRDPILHIALDLGYDNLSHFYRLFKRRFQCTPRQFRQRQHTPLQPTPPPTLPTTTSTP
ncbi:MAG: AraC family transcriptional regulator [Planctomycetota bacterium]